MGDDDWFEALQLDGTVVRCGAGGRVGTVQCWKGSVAFFGDRDDVAQQVASLPGVGEPGVGVGFVCPRLAEFAQGSVEWTLGCVPVCFGRGEVRGAESDAIIRSVGRPDALTARPVDDERRTLRWAITHVMTETTRHAGHADILRELIDGVTGR